VALILIGIKLVRALRARQLFPAGAVHVVLGEVRLAILLIVRAWGHTADLVPVA
jgi:hypothetical protein